MKRVLVTGATGAIGPALVRRLMQAGCQVRVLVHRSPPDALPAGFETLQADLTDCASLRAAVREIDTVFHLAALLHINDPARALRSEYTRINVEGTRNVVEASHAAGVARMLFFSSINVYGPGKPGLMFDETSPLKPESWYAETKAAAEQVALSGMPAVVLRPAAVYGPRLKGNYARLLDALRRRRFVMVGAGRNRRTLVHVADLCEAAVLAATHPDAIGQIYNVTDGRLHTLREIIAAMCGALGKPPPRFYMPLGAARLLLSTLDGGLRLAGRTSPARRSLLDKFTEESAVSGDKMQARLGYRARVGLAAGWESVVARILRQAQDA